MTTPLPQCTLAGHPKLPARSRMMSWYIEKKPSALRSVISHSLSGDDLHCWPAVEPCGCLLKLFHVARDVCAGVVDDFTTFLDGIVSVIHCSSLYGLAVPLFRLDEVKRDAVFR